MDPVAANPNTGEMFNRYRYAANNPYRFVDPDGREEQPYFVNQGQQSSSFLDGGSVSSADMASYEERFDSHFSDPGIGEANQAALVATAQTALLAVPGGAAVRSVAIALRVRGVSPAQANKIHHIFSNAEHNLGGLAKSMGGEVRAFRAIERATTRAVGASKAGKFETVVKVGGREVTVRGNVVDGKVKIGTAIIKPPPPPVPKAPR